VKVADFGFCKSVSGPGEMTSTMVGSPIYMAPEILKGMPYTTKADIWSLGVVMFECLFGYCPYEDKSIAKLIGLIDSAKPLLFPRHINPISHKTEELLRSMLSIDVKKRVSWQALFNFEFNFHPDRTPSTQPRSREKENINASLLSYKRTSAK
jgi:serine/threonine protein kinase